MWEGFDRHLVDIGGLRLWVRTAGVGEPLLLLHGHAQNGNAWHRVAPSLARDFRVIVPDLRGAGASDCPTGSLDVAAWSDRRLGRDMRLLLARLGLARTAVLAHDGGAQVVLRMALDHPGCLTRIAVVEGLPNGALWAGSDGPGAAQCFVRLLLAQPAGLAERLIGADPDGFVDKLLGGGTAAGSVFAFHPAALRSYRQQMRDPDRLAALCARHRAGAGPDRQRDLADAAQGRGLTVPLHLVCATGPGRVFERDLPAGWAPWSDRAGFTEIESGHFAPEENPEALLAAVRPFLLDRRPVSTEDRRAA